MQLVGVLKALGVGPFDVMRMILLECAIQTSIAIGIGLTLSIPSILYLATSGIDLGTLAGTSVMGLAMDPIWRAEISAAAFVAPIVVLVTIVGLAALYPAVKAAWIHPVEAMRHR